MTDENSKYEIVIDNLNGTRTKYISYIKKENQSIDNAIQKILEKLESIMLAYGELDFYNLMKNYTVVARNLSTV